MQILFFILLLCPVFAQDLSSILYYKGRSLGNTPVQQISKTQEILKQVKEITDSRGVTTEIKTLKDRQGNSYPVMHVLPVGGSDLNLEASRVARAMGNIPLLFSPYDLGRSGSAAFFDPDGSKIGVSYDFILGDKNDPSYVHEIYHANTYLKALSGKPSPWAGLLKLTAGQYMSRGNRDYYSRFAALDEIVTTALSLKLDTARLLEFKRISTPMEFNKDRGYAYNLLSEVYLSSKAGYYLARQLKDIAERSLLVQAQASSTPLKLGQISKPLPTTVSLLDSFSWEFVAGKGQDVVFPKGTEFRLYWPSVPTPADHQARLNEIVRRAALAEVAFNETGKCISIMIEYPEVARTNYGCLEQNAARAFAILEP